MVSILKVGVWFEWLIVCVCVKVIVLCCREVLDCCADDGGKRSALGAEGWFLIYTIGSCSLGPSEARVCRLVW